MTTPHPSATPVHHTVDDTIEQLDVAMYQAALTVFSDVTEGRQYVLPDNWRGMHLLVIDAFLLAAQQAVLILDEPMPLDNASVCAERAPLKEAVARAITSIIALAGSSHDTAALLLAFTHICVGLDEPERVNDWTEGHFPGVDLSRLHAMRDQADFVYGATLLDDGEMVPLERPPSPE